MKFRYLAALLLIIAYGKTIAQTCTHTSLSKKYNYRLTRIIGHKSEDGNVDSKVIMQIIDKKSKTVIQTTVIQADFLFETAYRDCKAVRSYITGKNKNAEIADSDYGDLIVADLNFDGKEDLAIKHDSGGASGPAYEFYLQNKKGNFVKDDFLTVKMHYFPSQIDSKHKMLYTANAAGAYWLSEKVFKYSPSLNKWTLVKSELIKI